MSNTDKSTEIAIIGAGFSGMMTAYHLVREAIVPLTIHIINSRDTFGRGPAYSTTHLRHLLNVPAAKMSALTEDSNHFLDWIHQLEPYQSIPNDTLGKTFLPRKLYGDYFNSLWHTALINKRADTTVNIVYDKAVDIEKNDGRYSIKLESGSPVAADFVVIATGNETPSDPPISNEDFYKSYAYIKNPWLTDVTKYIKKDQNILILGNGLTTVDLIISIMDAGYQGIIHTLSPTGFSVLPHRHNHLEYKELVNELKEPYMLDEIYAKVHAHYKNLYRVGISIEPIIDSLRPHTHKIWKSLSIEDKQRFLKEFKTNWNKVRHRMAPQLYDYVQRLRMNGKVQVHTANLIDINEEDNLVRVEYHSKKTGQKESLSVGLVVNCTGPHIDINRSEDPLLQALTRKGMIRPDSLRIGMDVTDEWTLIDKNGDENEGLYTIGGNLRGLLWETTAVPELKVQSATLAKRIFEKMSS